MENSEITSNKQVERVEKDGVIYEREIITFSFPKSKDGSTKKIIIVDSEGNEMLNREV